jgi:RNA polymerase sigma factor (sigma-70 family)
MTPLLSKPLLRAQSDDRLAELAAAGHDRAFEAIVERYRKPLDRYLRRLLSEQLAEDVLQATFVRAWQALGAGTEVRDLRPWLYRIAHNQAVNALRAAGPPESQLPPGLAALAAAPDVAAEHGEAVRSALRGIDGLPDRQRAALMAVAVDDRPHADVAAELELSDGALRQLLLRARTALRAAATAITPYPLVSWLAAGQDAGAARVAEVAAGAGGIGVAAKAGAALLAAGALVAGAPALRDEHVPHVTRSAEQSDSKPEHATSTNAHPAVRRVITAPASPRDATTPGAGHHRRSGGSGPGERHRRSGSSGLSPGDDDDRFGSGDSGSSGPDEDGHGGPGPSAPKTSAPSHGGEDRRTSAAPSAGVQSSGPGSSESGGSGSTSGAPAPAPAPTDGSGSGSSGSSGGSSGPGGAR